MYFLNTKYLMFRPHRDRNFSPIGEDRMNPNQDATIRLVGFAGNSFSVGIAWVSAWWPQNRQGMALGVFGAIVCLAAPLREFLVNRCRNFIFATAPAPLVAAALLELDSTPVDIRLENTSTTPDTTQRKDKKRQDIGQGGGDDERSLRYRE